MRHPNPSRFSPAPLALAIAIAIALAAPTFAHAQAPASVAISITAQPLGDALNELAAATATPIVFSQALVAGKQAPAVSGNLTPQQALDRLLAGSALTALREGNAIVIRAAQAGDNTMLPLVVVRATPELDATTEGGGYAARAVTMFGNTQSLKKIPSSVSVLTRQQMDDQNISSIDDAMRNTTGVSSIGYFGTGGAGNASYFNSRGFPVNVALDGLSIINGIQYQPQFDMALYDRIEIFRGPSGLLSGQGDLGGSVNLVRKMPTDKFQFKSETSIGSWENYRQMIDVSGPLNKEGTLRGRVVGLAGKSNSFLDGQNSSVGMGYGVLEYDIDPRTTVSLSAGYQKAPTHRPDFGVGYDSADQLVIGPRGWSQNFAPDWSYVSSTFKEVSASAKHRFDNGWRAEATVLSRKYISYSKYAFADTPNAGLNTADYYGQRQSGDYDWLGWDARVTGSANLFGSNADVLLGINHTSYRYTGRYGSDALGSYNIFAPVITEPEMPYTSGGKTKVDQTSVYGHVNSHLTEKLSVVLGGRYMSFKQQSKTTMPTESAWETDAKENGKLVPYGGLIYALSPEISAYGSYSKIFSVQTNSTFSGSAIQPLTGEQYEVGLKGSFLENKLNASLAAFRINGNNLAVADQLHPGFSVSSGTIRSQGVEAEISGAPMPNLDLSASYTFASTKNTSSPTDQGLPYSSETPKHLVKLWSTYRFTQDSLKGLTVGGGMYFQSNTWRYERQYRQGAYATFSAKLGYKFNEHVALDLTVKNLFDKQYYSRAPYVLFAEYGAPRNATLTLRVSY